MLTKHNVCLFINDEEHLDEMRNLLVLNNQKIHNKHFYLSYPLLYKNYLQLVNTEWKLCTEKSLTEVTTEQFKKLWE